MNPSIILVRPQMGENIGAAARVMLNFAFDDLRIVEPRDGWPNEQAIRMASGAAAILENAKIFPTLQSATADLQYLYATTARRRDIDKPAVAPKQINVQPKTGLIFGPERIGLTNEEISLCDKIISIPVNPQFSSLNLAQSIAIIVYETSQIVSVASDERKLAAREELYYLFEHLETELDKSGFYQVPEKKPSMVLNMRAMLTRAELSNTEVQILRGIIRSLTSHSHKND